MARDEIGHSNLSLEGTDNSYSGSGELTGTIKMMIAFPGSITDASPEFVKVDDRTVMLDASFSDPLDVYAERAV